MKKPLLGSCLAITTLVACPTPQSMGEDEANESGTTAGCQAGALDCECVGGACLGQLECVAGLCMMPAEPDATGEESTSESTGSTSESNGTTSESTDSTTGDGDGDGSCARPTGTNEGCEFQAVKLPMLNTQILDQWPAIFAVTNTSAAPSEIVIERRNAGNWLTVHGPLILEPLETDEFVSTLPSDIVYQGLADEDAYRIRSTEPVVVRQFNTNVANAGLGATTLLPSASWDHDYRAMVGNNPQQQPYAVVVAAKDATSVEVELRGAIVAGPGIPASTAAGTIFEVVLDAGQTLGIFSNDIKFIGTRISSDPEHPIGVFSGSRGLGYDRSEEQLLGTNQWSTDYLCPYIRNQQLIQPSSWRVYGNDPATFFTFDDDSNQALPVGPQQIAVAGDSFHLAVTSGFGVSATKPIGMMALLRDSNVNGSLMESYAQMPGIDRFLARYVVHAPTGTYTAHILTVVRPTGSTVQIDGAVGVPFETKSVLLGWEMVRFSLLVGTHELIGSEPFLAIVNGWGSQERSYMYVAGMAL